MAITPFEERNKSTYTKAMDVPVELINKYIGILPDDLLTIWDTMGFGIYENGFLQLVNPDEYEFVFDYIDKLLEPSIVFGVTGMGDLLIWEGNGNKTIAENEGNRVLIVNIRKCRSRASTNLRNFIDVFLSEYFISDKEYFDSKSFLEMKNVLANLHYGECYGYVPALVLGGRASNKNLQIVDTKAYIEIIGQAVGKIIDLS